VVRVRCIAFLQERRGFDRLTMVAYFAEKCIHSVVDDWMKAWETCGTCHSLAELKVDLQEPAQNINLKIV
jgi:hypothetical protein